MRRRRLRILLLILVALPLGAFLALRCYLASEAGRRRVEAELADAIGARLELDGVDAGILATSLRGLRVFLDGRHDGPTVAIAELRISLPLWKLLDQSAVRRELTLKRAAITLPFDRDGHILIAPPQKEGAGVQDLLVHLEDARFTLRQEGKPDLQVDGIDATLRGKNGKLTLKGTAADPAWGNWTLLGMVETANGAASLQLKTEHAELTAQRLAAIPFVDDEVWGEVTAEGASAVDVKVWHRPAERLAHYRVKLAPREVRLRVAAIDLDASDVAGRVTIEDGRITLEQVTGAAAGGKIMVQGELDFRTKPEQLRFQVKAVDLDLRGLPTAWNIPEFLAGQLSGQAELGIELLGDRIRTMGQGQGQIVKATVGGSPTAAPVAMQLVSEGKGFRFQAGPTQSTLWSHFDSEIARLAGGIWQHVTKPFMAAGSSLANWQLATRSEGQPAAYLQFHAELKEVDLGRFLSGIGIPLAVPVEGQAAIDVQLDLPMNTLNEPKCYRLAGTVQLPWLKVADMEFHNVAARLDFRDGVLQVSELSGRSGGPFRGTASLELVPVGRLDANISLEGVPLPKILVEANNLSGWLSGQLHARVPLQRFGDISAWQVAARIDDSRLFVLDRLLSLTAEEVTLRNGLLGSEMLRANVDGQAITGGGSLVVSKPHAFDLTLGLQDVEANQLAQLLEVPPPPLPITGVISGSTRVQGTLQPCKLQAAGRATTAALALDRLPIQKVVVDWKTDGALLRVDAASARYGFGDIRGSAVLPLHGDEPGHITLQACEIDLAPFARQLAGLTGIEGRGFGTIRADIAQPDAAGRRGFTWQIAYAMPRVKVQALAGERLQGTARYDGTAWDYRCDGELLGGRLHVEGTVTADRLPVSRLTVEGAQVDRLRRELMEHPDQVPLHGRLDLELAVRAEGNDASPSARGRAFLQQLRWNTSEIADRLTADVQFRGSEISVENINGSFCRGLLRGRAALSTSQAERSWFDLTLDRGELQDVLIPWPEAQGQGTVEARLQGTLGQLWRTSGTLALSRGRLFGIEVAEWRAPLDVSYSPSSGTGQLEIRESHAQIAHGRAVGQASYSWGHSNRLDAKARFIDLNVHELVPAAAGFTRLDGGTVTGRIDLAGMNLHSVNDLTGTLEATLKQTQPFEFPVFQQLAPYVAPRQSRRVPFETGDIKARLAHGVVHVEHLRLTGGVVQLLLEGSLSLQGRVDLDVTASTGLNAIQSSLLRRLGVDIPASGPIPRSALARATSQLSARLVRLKVTGSTRTPQVQIVPLYQLTEEALRFFLTGSKD